MAMIAGCGGGGHASKPSSDASVGTPIARTSTTTTTASSATHTAAAPKQAPTQPELVVLRTALSNALGKGGPDTGAMVYDLTAKQTLFAVRADVGRPPASVEKLYTTVATLDDLGPNARL
jgi:D-alanyl-D-alanine carboxypeptidase